MMIQQILPPQKPLLLHIYTTSEKIFSGKAAHSKIFRGSHLVREGKKKGRVVYLQRAQSILLRLVVRCFLGFLFGLQLLE